MERVGDGLQIDKDLIPNETEKAAIQQKIQERQQAQMAQMFAQEAAKQAPKMIADAAGAEERMAA